MSDEQDSSDPAVNMNAHVNMRAGSVGDGGHFTGLHADRVDNLYLQISKEPRIPLDLPGRPEVLEGRDLLVKDILEALTPGKVVSLVGPGGVGKSSLAAEVLWQLCKGKAAPPAAFPDGIFWHSFYHQPDASTALAAIAIAFGEDVKAAGGPDLAAKLALSGKTALLVLDGAEACAYLDEILALRAGCGVLVTTRKSAQAGRIFFDVPTLDETPGVQVLKAWGGEWADHVTALKQIVELTGGLALALELAGKYIGTCSIRSGEYLTWLAKSHLQALDHGQRQRESVKVLLERSVAALSEAGKTTLGVFGLLGLGRVSTEILAEGMKVDEGEALPALGELAGLGLARRAGNDWEVSHTLVHAYARQEVEPHSKALEQLALRYAWLATEANEKGIPAAFAGLGVHLAALAELGEAAGLEFAGTLWNEQGYHSNLMGDYASARSNYERALRIDEAAFGPDHPNVARDVSNLGGVLHALGDLQGAQAAYERALCIDEAALGPDHPNVASAVNNLGSVLQDLGDLQGAKAAFERALRIFEKHLGREHPNVTTLVNNLGGVLHALGDLQGAQATFERALRIDEVAFGPDHPKVAIRVNNLGSVLRALGDLQGAKAAYERALRIDEAAFGPDHPNVATAVNNLGLVLQDLGDLQGAQAAYERALRIDEVAYGPDHPNVATAVNNLGLVLQILVDLQGAKAAFERASRILEKYLPPGHFNIRTVRDNLEGVIQEIKQRQGKKDHS